MCAGTTRWTLRWLRASLGLTTLLAVGCVEQLPPPEAPSRELDPALVEQAFETRTEDGEGVVVLDITGEEHARVEDLGSELDGAGAQEVCETPCVTTLAVGEHRLVFHQGGRDDSVSLQVANTPRAHRRVMSYDSGEHTDYVALAVSGLTIGLLGGLPMLDPLTSFGEDFGTLSDVALVTGAALFGAAVVAGIVGVVLLITDPRQSREGASAEWELAPPR